MTVAVVLGCSRPDSQVTNTQNEIKSFFEYFNVDPTTQPRLYAYKHSQLLGAQRMLSSNNYGASDFSTPVLVLAYLQKPEEASKPCYILHLSWLEQGNNVASVELMDAIDGEDILGDGSLRVSPAESNNLWRIGTVTLPTKSNSAGGAVALAGFGEKIPMVRTSADISLTRPLFVRLKLSNGKLSRPIEIWLDDSFSCIEGK